MKKASTKICCTLSPPTKKRSTAAMLMPCFSQSPDSTSLIENPDLTAILLDEPSGRFTQQYLGDFSLSGTNAGSLEASDLTRTRKRSQCPMEKLGIRISFQILYESNQLKSILLSMF